jgi:hypothetical protein
MEQINLGINVAIFLVGISVSDELIVRKKKSS